MTEIMETFSRSSSRSVLTDYDCQYDLRANDSPEHPFRFPEKYIELRVVGVWDVETYGCPGAEKYGQE
jgi:hypothetical protein